MHDWRSRAIFPKEKFRLHQNRRQSYAWTSSRPRQTVLDPITNQTGYSFYHSCVTRPNPHSGFMCRLCGVDMDSIDHVSSRGSCAQDGPKERSEHLLLAWEGYTWRCNFRDSPREVSRDDRGHRWTQSALKLAGLGFRQDQLQGGRLWRHGERAGAVPCLPQARKQASKQSQRLLQTKASQVLIGDNRWRDQLFGWWWIDINNKQSAQWLIPVYSLN